MCNATQDEGELSYLDFSATAKHRETLISHQAYIESCAREAEQPSHIFKCPGVLLDHLCVDSMHAGDLGTFQDALGSLFWLEISHKPWHRNVRIGLIRLNQDLKKYYSANKDLKLSSIHPIVLSQIKVESHYPVLKSKAAQCRHLAEFGLILAHRHRNGTPGRPPFAFRADTRLTPYNQEYLDSLVTMFEGLTRYHRLCAGSPFDEEACRSALYTYLQALGNLNRIWRVGLDEEARNMPYHVRPKTHAIQHLGADKLCLWGSPPRSWCYRDEDFVGRVKTIAQKTSHPFTLEQRVLEKLMILEGLGESV
jgi:hypothetical protein